MRMFLCICFVLSIAKSNAQNGTIPVRKNKPNPRLIGSCNLISINRYKVARSGKTMYHFSKADTMNFGLERNFTTNNLIQEIFGTYYLFGTLLVIKRIGATSDNTTSFEKKYRIEFERANLIKLSSGKTGQVFHSEKVGNSGDF